MVLLASASLLLIPLLFAVAAIGKLLGGFSRSQQALAGFDVPKPLLLPFHVALPLAEMTAALLLMFQRTAWWGGVAALALLVLFNAAIQANLAVGKVEEDHEISH